MQRVYRLTSSLGGVSPLQKLLQVPAIASLPLQNFPHDLLLPRVFVLLVFRLMPVDIQRAVDHPMSMFLPAQRARLGRRDKATSDAEEQRVVAAARRARGKLLAVIYPVVATAQTTRFRWRYRAPLAAMHNFVLDRTARATCSVLLLANLLVGCPQMALGAS